MSLAGLLLHPGWTPALLLVPAVWAGLVLLDRRRRRRTRTWVGERSDTLTESASRPDRALPRVLLSLAVLFVVVAALGPLLGTSTAAAEWQGVDLVVGLDVSRSMRARDLAPDRLGRAQREIGMLAERAGGDRLALVVFAGEARRTVPLTTDAASFRALAALADPTSIARGGTDLGAALDAALDALPAESSRPGVIMLLTDGEDHEARGLAAAQRCRARGVTVHCIGLGTPGGSRIPLAGSDGRAFLRDARGREVISALDTTGLDRIADATGGTVVVAASHARPLADLYDAHVLPRAHAARGPAGEGERENAFAWPLLLALLLLAAEFALGDGRAATVSPRRGGAASAALVLGLLGLTACDAVGAGGDATEEGRDALAAGRPAEALAAFDAAIERAGDGASAELHFDSLLASLQLERWAEAEASAESAEARGGAAFAGLAAFVRGHAAYARSVAAEAAADAGDSEALAAALTLAEDALAAWQWAAASRARWPQARRNAERAFLRLQSLRETRADATQPPPEGPPPPPPPPPPPDPTRPEEENPDASPEFAALPAERVAGVLELLHVKEREKRARRQAEHAARFGRSGTEKDW